MTGGPAMEPSFTRQDLKNAIPDLNVPIVVDVGVGDNWLEAH